MSASIDASLSNKVFSFNKYRVRPYFLMRIRLIAAHERPQPSAQAQRGGYDLSHAA